MQTALTCSVRTKIAASATSATRATMGTPARSAQTSGRSRSWTPSEPMSDTAMSVLSMKMVTVPTA
ncbi:hypothetical protein FHX72_000315 [Pseudoclavibacter helvolus]|uniref:Uncharacterized protein n=1 Tax=Pseudoclavibacter helvolus TaxID=255205 RepID=A0A7W4UL53_9MICO|nr:hypothetical protein [Pseudoclavibacter helvolus]